MTDPQAEVLHQIKDRQEARKAARSRRCRRCGAVRAVAGGEVGLLCVTCALTFGKISLDDFVNVIFDAAHVAFDDERIAEIMILK